MDLGRRSLFVYALLLALWLVVAGWQAEEHVRFKAYARTALRNRSKAIASMLGASIRGLQIRGAVFGNRLQPVLDELVNARSNQLETASEVTSVYLLNAAGEAVASAGRTIDLEQRDILQEGERWGKGNVTFVYPVEGAPPEGGTNTLAPVVIPGFTNGPRSFPRREPRGEESRSNRVESFPPPEGEHPPAFISTNDEGALVTNEPLPRPERPPRPADGERSRRPFWARGMNEKDYAGLMQKKELHGLVLSMPLDAYYAASLHDLWLRFVIGFFATVSVVGSGLAWRNVAKTSELQIRLVRASELTTHLREMNLAAAGLAHETRNPLNIIRGLAQMISKQADTAPDVRERSREIINEADKVASQLNEFINYSRPREVRRTAVQLNSVVKEVVRALDYDIEEKKIVIETKGEQLAVEADEQLLRQALFNLLLNATQAVGTGGEIQVVAEKRGSTEAVIEVRDNGPGVPAERRSEIFKPYFTTEKTGTGLGLAVVQQIVLAHGWDVECVANDPKGAVFRISHIRIAA
ncbi:MAG TPA: ATP-binding protein [Candidatus Dormibacteraeota bacterium]|nr:ATP-binding protein [Candidatus Dormibacteraeota bacterium]